MPPWTSAEIKSAYGEDYPAAIVEKGTRIPLASESRFLRSYSSDEEIVHQISRFMDGSASMTASELRREWPDLTEGLRTEFCYQASWLSGQADFPEMLRFILQHGGSEQWAGIALSVASELPRQEAFDSLVEALGKTKLGCEANLAQAIAQTKHPDAEATLRSHLKSLWAHPALWDNDEFTNRIAFSATVCIQHLIEVGAPPSDFEVQVRRLSEHVCSGSRYTCRDYLSKHYLWLKGQAADPSP